MLTGWGCLQVTDFEFNQELSVFDMLGINLLHGWLYDPQDTETAELIKGLSYNQVVRARGPQTARAKHYRPCFGHPHKAALLPERVVHLTCRRPCMQLISMLVDADTAGQPETAQAVPGAIRPSRPLPPTTSP